MKNFFGSQIVHLVLWATACYLAHRFIGPYYVLIPAIGGLGLWFYLNRDKPAPKGPAAVLLLLLLGAAAASCQRGPTQEQLAETRTAEQADTVWATTTARENGWDVTSAK